MRSTIPAPADDQNRKAIGGQPEATASLTRVAVSPSSVPTVSNRTRGIERAAASERAAPGAGASMIEVSRTVMAGRPRTVGIDASLRYYLGIKYLDVNIYGEEFEMAD